jgi:hypothetical protein
MSRTQHSRAYLLAVAAFMGIFMFGYDTVSPMTARAWMRAGGGLVKQDEKQGKYAGTLPL